MAWPVDVEVTVDLAQLTAHINAIQTSTGPVQQVLDRWGVRMRAFLTRRFIAEGYGSWPPLRYRLGQILRDTGTLLQALDPGAPGPGGMEERDNDDEGASITVGYMPQGMGPPHPSTGAQDVTIGDIAFFHQTGAGNNPVREIVVEPDADTIAAMIQDVEELLGGW